MVIDGGGSAPRPCFGDQLAIKAVEQGWKGSDQRGRGMWAPWPALALGSRRWLPARSRPRNGAWASWMSVVSFAGVTIAPGDMCAPISTACW